ncbi:polysaccharide biosynthesis protein, partial [Fulvivirga kasyanovii]|nr:polysaccharide biosynthesis protein [Fulvivirga kasyanovii]
KKKYSLWQSLLSFPKFLLFLTKHFVSAMIKHRFKYVISTGPGISIFFCILFKLMGKKIIHLETWSRFYSKSNTGRWMYHIADYFYIQNESLKTIYPKAIYVGRL